MHEWLEQAAARLAEQTGSEVSAYELTQEEVDDLLELAKVAARESGERTNAPLLCYLVGLARARGGGDVGALVDSVVGKRV